MAADMGITEAGRSFSVERRFEGSVFDIAVARRFARVTALWWGVRPEPLEHRVDELARRAVCEANPAFTVALAVEGANVEVRVDPAPERRESPAASHAAGGRT